MGRQIEGHESLNSVLNTASSIQDVQSNNNSLFGAPGANSQSIRRDNKFASNDSPRDKTDQPKSTTNSKPAQPLQTSRLRPYRQRHNRSVMSILDNGKVCIELLKEEKVKEVRINVGF